MGPVCSTLPSGEDGVLEMLENGRSRGKVSGHKGYVEGKTIADDVIASLMYEELHRLGVKGPYIHDFEGLYGEGPLPGAV